MQFVDLKTQQKQIRSLIEQNLMAVLDHGLYINGPEIQQIEKILAEFVGTKYAIACSSGTDALLIALMALKIRPNDAVITTPFTFVATAEVISRLGAIPVFVDIDPVSYNLSPDELSRCMEALHRKDSSIHPLPGAILKKTFEPKAIIGVDLFGLPAAYDEINSIARKNNLAVIEDAAQSMGAEYRGKRAGSFGDIGCTSFFPAKPLGCYGDGGMCFTDSDRLNKKMLSIREHGQGNHKYDNTRIGVNGRMDTLQAAILLAKFEIFPQEIIARQEIAHQYTELLSSVESLRPPQSDDGATSAWSQYSVLSTNSEERQRLIEKLTAAGVPAAIYYPKPLHLLTAFHRLGYKTGDFPVSENIAERIFSLPMHPYLSKETQRMIVDLIIARK